MKSRKSARLWAIAILKKLLLLRWDMWQFRITALHSPTGITAITSHHSLNYKIDEINDLNEDLLRLRNGIGDNITDTNNENNHDNTNLAKNVLKSNNTLGAHIVEEKEGWFYGWANTHDKWNNYYHIPTEENEPRSSHTFMGNNSIYKLTKTKYNGKSKKRLVSEVSTSINSDFYIGGRQKKHWTFEPNY